MIRNTNNASSHGVNILVSICRWISNAFRRILTVLQGRVINKFEYVLLVQLGKILKPQFKYDAFLRKMTAANIVFPV